MTARILIDDYIGLLHSSRMRIWSKINSISSWRTWVEPFIIISILRLPSHSSLLSSWSTVRICMISWMMKITHFILLLWKIEVHNSVFWMSIVLLSWVLLFNSRLGESFIHVINSCLITHISSWSFCKWIIKTKHFNIHFCLSIICLCV